MKKLLASAVLALSLAGCATTSVIEPRTEVSSFDGTKSVVVAPQAAVCTNYVTCSMLGFVWNDKSKDVVGIRVDVIEPLAGEYHAIKSLRLNIDGDIIEVKPFPTGTNDFNYDTMYKTTTRMYVASIPLLEQIEQSSNTKIQVVSDGAIIEGDLKDGGKNTKAYYAMLKFLGQVKANK